MNDPRSEPSTVRAILDYVRQTAARESSTATPDPNDPFDELVRQAFRLQYERLEPFRRLCDERGVAPDTLRSWRDVPWVPVSAFRTLDLSIAAADDPVEIFRSSGTTDPGARSVHRHPFPDLYRATIDASFPGAVFRTAATAGGVGKPDALSLVVSRSQSTESSLGFMIDHVLRRHAGPGSLEALGTRGVEAAAARSWLGAHQRAGQPVAILATGFSLVDLLEALERLEIRFRLPPGSVVFETGGLKGRTREVSRAEVLERLWDRLAVPPERVVREYGMTELTSQCYTRTLTGGDPDLFVPPHWMRVQALDPETLFPVDAGVPGLLAIFDLANLGSSLHVLTQDLGVIEGQGFRLLGRAAGAPPRGCSLTVEEMMAR